MSFSFAQTFYVDADRVQLAAEVGISAVELYFRGKPKATNNKSGIENPGARVFIAPTKEGIPVINELAVIRPQEPTEHGARFLVKTETARREYDEIKTSTDATVPTVFKFANPIQVNTDQLWALVVKFDGDEDFILWTAKSGDVQIDNFQRYTGAGDFQGKLYGFISPVDTQHTPGLAGFGYGSFVLDPAVADDPAVSQIDQAVVETRVAAAQAYLQNAWKPYADEDLMFGVYAAAYADNGYPVSANSSYPIAEVEPALIPPTVLSNNLIRIIAPSRSYEFFKFDRLTSNTNNLKFGDWFWQDTPAFPGGTSTPLTVTVTNNSINVVANSAFLYANGTTFNNANGWNDVYQLASDNEYIIIDNTADIFLRKVTGILSNTVLTIDEPVPVTNNVAKFYKAPVGRLINKTRTYAYGLVEEIGRFADSSPNSSVRFVNNCIESIGITTAGQGYSNSDYIVISGYEDVAGKVSGGYSAYANIVTNASGNVTSILMSNVGCGFVLDSWLQGSNVVVANSQGDPVPSGTANNLTMSFNIGCTLKSVYSAANQFFTNCQFVNMPVSQIKPEITVNNPAGTGFVTKFGTSYYRVADGAIANGEVIYGDDDMTETEQVVKIFKEHSINPINDAIVPSRSNEFVTHYSNGSLVNATPYTFDSKLNNAAYYIFEVSSNNDYQIPFFQPEVTQSHLTKYVINNDYTNEHTNYGNAYAKHVVTKVNFQEDRLAEDIVVYLTAYRPVGTDFKVYARIHNSADFEAFDDKDWTLLDSIDGGGVYSSQVDDSDMIELTYGFNYWPNNAFTQSNTVTAVLDSANLDTSGPDLFDSAIVANDMIRIYQPLFPNNYVVDVVSSVTNTSQIILRNPVANDSIVGSGLKIEKIAYPKQGFKYVSNSNVVRYYNDSKALFTRYDTFQIKVILLGDDPSGKKIPKIDDIRSVGVTA